MCGSRARALALAQSVRTRFSLRTGLGSSLHNAGWLLADKFLRMAAGLVVGAWVARHLGPAQFGLFNYANAFAMLFSILGTLGLSGIVVRDILHEPQATGEVLGTTFLLKALGGAIAVLAGALVVGLFDPGPDRVVLWMVAIISLGNVFQAADVVDYWLQSRVQSKYVVIAKIGPFLVCTLAKLTFILLDLPVIWFALIASVETVLGSLGLWEVYRRLDAGATRWSIRRARARQLLSDSWPLLFSGLIGIVYLRIDQVMLGRMVGNEELGLYSAAVRLAEVWYMVPMVAMSSLFPRILEKKRANEDAFHAAMQRLYNFMTLIGYAVALPVTLLAPWIVHVLFGAKYGSSAPMLAVLIWAGVFVNLGVARGAFLTAMNWTKVHLFCNGAGCLLNIALNWVLIPHYGGLGAAVASCVSYWFAAHGSCWFLQRTRRTGSMMLKAMAYPKAW